MKLTLIPGDGSTEARTAEIVEQIHDLLHDYPGLSIAAAVGALEVAKWELLERYSRGDGAPPAA